ncbi:hypothetical protein [Nocardiopsis valliformis]|uniref:hypothetical protein n=1 Tax=Nocardiopsis valliformis TaxID=239974 RepID=UPI0003787400|nr:hypothetical protein [Nocardiopsis valliformis]
MPSTSRKATRPVKRPQVGPDAWRAVQNTADEAGLSAARVMETLLRFYAEGRIPDTALTERSPVRKQTNMPIADHVWEASVQRAKNTGEFPPSVPDRLAVALAAERIRFELSVTATAA